MSQNDGQPIKKVVQYNLPDGTFFIRIGTQQQHNDFYEKWELDITKQHDKLPVDQVYNMMTDPDFYQAGIFDEAKVATLPKKIDFDKIIDLKAPKEGDLVKVEAKKGGRRTRRRRKRSGGTRKAEKKALPTISSNFESGNIKKIKIDTKKNNYQVVLEIEHEPYHSHVKKKYENWFYFKVSNIQRKNINYTIQDIRIFDDDWRGFNVCYSYNNKNWKRIKTSFSKKNRTLKWNHKTTKKNIFFAYYPPYTTVMKNTLINKYKNKIGVKHLLLNKNIDTLILGNGPLYIYIVARQHPGETIGSWMVEGFLKAYFSSKQRKVIEKLFTITVIPMANPHGVKAGHWYTNKKGQNLNRSWRHNKTPETTAIKKLLKAQEGVLYLDLHGDEGPSKHFITTCVQKQNTVHESFNKIMASFCPNFQLKDYYKRKKYKVYGTMDCFDKKKTLTIEGAMKHPLYKHKTLQDEGIEIGKAIYKTITHKISCVDN
jgi:hypothetical protein